MRIKLLKSKIHEDVMWPAESCVEMEDNRARFFVDSGDAIRAGEDLPLTPKPNPLPFNKPKEDNVEELAKLFTLALKKGMGSEDLDKGLKSAMRPIPKVA